MNTSPEYTRFDSFRLWLADQPAIIRIGIFTGIFTLFTAALYLIILLAARPENRVTLLLIYATTVFVGGLLFAVSFALLYKRQVKMIGQKIGVPDITQSELVQLHIWFRRGIQPVSTRIRTAEGSFLDYLQPFIEGKMLYASKKVSIGLIILFGINLIISLINLFTIQVHSFTRFLNPVIFSLLLIMYLSYFRKSGSPFAKLFNRKSTKLLQTRRAELK